MANRPEVGMDRFASAHLGGEQASAQQGRNGEPAGHDQPSSENSSAWSATVATQQFELTE